VSTWRQHIYREEAKYRVKRDIVTPTSHFLLKRDPVNSNVNATNSLATSDSVTVFGCGVEARIRISSDEDLELRDLMTKLGNLPARVNGAVIKSNNRSWYVRLNEMSDRNGIGKMPISPGDSIHFVHRNN
jgi:hypothetical protein